MKQEVIAGNSYSRSGKYVYSMLLAKRGLDIVVAIIGLLFSIPIIVICGLLIKAEDGGSVFYLSSRVGQHGRIFQMWKLRSMSGLGAKGNGSNTAGVVCSFKNRNQNRVTTVGRFLRTYSLDELPQFWNILIGDMSLVGPRPELPEIVSRYEPWQYERLRVPQGLTGWWQVNGRSALEMHLHTHIDIFYIRNWSFWLDLKILYQTLGVVVSGKGAY